MSHTKVVEKIKTHILLCSITFFFFRKLCSYEIMWKNTVEPDRPRITVWCIPKTTNTHSEYVIFIACPLQQWFHERASVLRFTYIAGLIWIFAAVLLRFPSLWNATPRRHLVIRADAVTSQKNGDLAQHMPFRLR